MHVILFTWGISMFGPESPGMTSTWTDVREVVRGVKVKSV